jgi:hypothetical protein
MGAAALVIDPWEKAVECERAIKACTDSKQMPILRSLREIWVNLAIQRALGVTDWHANADDIADAHADVMIALTLTPRQPSLVP